MDNILVDYEDLHFIRDALCLAQLRITALEAVEQDFGEVFDEVREAEKIVASYLGDIDREEEDDDEDLEQGSLELYFD